MKNYFIKFLALPVLVMALLASCGPTAHIETSQNANFSRYRTFAWAQPKDRRQRSSMMEDQIKNAITVRLEQNKGWRQVNNNPDVILSYDVLVQRGRRVMSDPMYGWGGFRTFYNPYRGRFYNVYYPSMFMGYDNYSVPTKEGTITVTMVDSYTDQTIMQGWATDEVDSRRISGREIDRIVDAIFRKWEATTRYNNTERGNRKGYDRYGNMH